MLVKQIAGAVPYIAQVVDTQLVFCAFLFNKDVAFLARLSQLDVANASLIEQFLHFALLLVIHLDYNTGILGKKDLDNIVALHLVQTDFQTAFGICKSHFQQCGNQTTGADIVSGQYQSFLDKFLHGVECCTEIIAVLDGGHIITNLVQTLSESRSAQTKLVKAEINMIKCRRSILDNRRNDLLDVAYLSATGHNHSSRRDDFLAIGVFLCHTQRVLSSGHINLQLAAEIAQCLNGLVEAGILAFLGTARPHPVGRKAYAVQSVFQRSPNNICQ